MTHIGLSTPDEILAALRRAFTEMIRLNVQVRYDDPRAEDNPVGDHVMRVLEAIEEAMKAVEAMYPFDDDGQPRPLAD